MEDTRDSWSEDIDFAEFKKLLSFKFDIVIQSCILLCIEEVVNNEIFKC